MIDITTKEGNKILYNLLERGLFPTIDCFEENYLIIEREEYSK